MSTEHCRRIATILLLLVVGFCTPTSAQQPPLPSEVVELLKQLEAIGKKAGEQLRPPIQPATTEFNPKTTEELQQALNTATPGSIIRLEPGTIYRSVRIRPLPNQVTAIDRKLLVTTRSFNIGDRMVTPADAPAMAVIKAADRESFGVWVEASGVTLHGLRFSYADPIGQGEMLRLGDSEQADPVNTPGQIRVLQSLFQGRTTGETSTTSTFGQKRAIAANSKDTLIDQIWCEDIWIVGQDSQCVIGWSGMKRVTVRRSFLSAGSENFMVGGSPPASPEQLPEDVVLEDSILFKPIKWRGLPRQVKNLYEVKIGRRITARRNLMVNHWVQAQPGPAIVWTLATNGRCTFCEGRDWVFEDNVVWGVSAGVVITGFQYYAPGAGNAEGFVIRNNIFHIDSEKWGGNGRPIFINNEPHNIRVERNTFIHNGNTFLYATYGTKWPWQDPPLIKSIPAGPVTGLKYLDNIALFGSYGTATPEGNAGLNLTQLFPGIEIRGNVLAGATTAALARYNALTGPVQDPNTGPTKEALMDALDANYCPKPGSFAEGRGADCNRLISVFALRQHLPTGQ
jgi:hypothetical protein